MTDRAAILDLADRAGAERNRPLRDLLLVVAGMCRGDGKVVDWPEETTRWHDVAGPHGPYGVGLALSVARRTAPEETHRR